MCDKAGRSRQHRSTGVPAKGLRCLEVYPGIPKPQIINAGNRNHNWIYADDADANILPTCFFPIFQCTFSIKVEPTGFERF